MSPQFESKEEVARANAAERAQDRCRSLEDQLATLRSEAAYVRGHLEDYAHAIDRKITLGDAWEFITRKQEVITALREDARRLAQITRRRIF